MAIPQEQHAASMSQPVDWVDQHGDALFGYAWLRVRSREAAEDLVQECFVAALGGRERFRGEASERTWLVGILKHKIVDYLRRVPRAQDAEESLQRAEQTERLAFTDKGFWKARAARWKHDPGRLIENQEFWEVLRRCLGQLPRRLADAFTLREMEQCSSEEVCQVLGLTPTNLWARLHRARLGLRHCLDAHWFKPGPSGQDERALTDVEG